MAVKGLEELKPVYLIYGSEELLLENALRRLRDRVSDVADLDFNFDVFDGERAEASSIISAANTLPFASERRLVVVRNVDKMSSADRAELAAYAADPAPSACVVLVAVKVTRNSTLFKAVDALGGVAEYAAPTKREYPQRVMELFEAKGRRIARDAAEALVRAVGRDLRRLDTEADKIIAYIGVQESVSRADVEQVVVATAPASVFDFLGALGARECGAALERLDDLLAGGEALLGIHAMTLRHLRQLVSVKALVDRGADRSVIARETGLQDWQVRNAAEQAARFSPSELARALREAAELEARLKSGQGEPRVLFEVWMTRVCSRES